MDKSRLGGGLREGVRGERVETGQGTDPACLQRGEKESSHGAGRAHWDCEWLWVLVHSAGHCCTVLGTAVWC